MSAFCLATSPFRFPASLPNHPPLQPSQYLLPSFLSGSLGGLGVVEMYRFRGAGGGPTQLSRSRGRESAGVILRWPRSGSRVAELKLVKDNGLGAFSS